MSYAAPQEGHLGIVYQATNWIYQGNTIRPNDSWVFKFGSNSSIFKFCIFNVYIIYFYEHTYY